MTEEWQLTLDIKQCQHWEQLQQLYKQDSEVMNTIHISALVTHLAQLGVSRPRWAPLEEDGPSTSYGNSRYPPQNNISRKLSGRQTASLPPGATRLMTSLLTDVRSRMRQLSARQIANVLWAVAKSGHQPGGEWMASIVGACGSRWEEFEPQHLANIAYAMALMGREPGKSWMQQLMQVGVQVLQQSHFGLRRSCRGWAGLGRVTLVMQVGDWVALGGRTQSVRLPTSWDDVFRSQSCPS